MHSTQRAVRLYFTILEGDARVDSVFEEGLASCLPQRAGDDDTPGLSIRTYCVEGSHSDDHLL